MWPFGTNQGGKPTTGHDLVYAVGDVHGRLDLLQTMVNHIAVDAHAIAPGQKPVLVLLGDYIDRGPQSRQVIEFAIELGGRGVFELHCLKGNHEQAMLAFLDDAATGPAWIAHGGAETLVSYGVQPPAVRAEEEAWALAQASFAAAVPPAHLAFLRSLESYFVVGDYLFVHAGVRPGVELHLQSESDMLWIRRDFLKSGRACEKVVVHGHTPSEQPHTGRWRIGIDTGAYATGLLTAVRLDRTARSILQARMG
jgi:serine/threonine protein phosphatase 1